MSASCDDQQNRCAQLVCVGRFDIKVEVGISKGQRASLNAPGGSLEEWVFRAAWAGRQIACYAPFLSAPNFQPWFQISGAYTGVADRWIEFMVRRIGT